MHPRPHQPPPAVLALLTQAVSPSRRGLHLLPMLLPPCRRNKIRHIFPSAAAQPPTTAFTFTDMLPWTV